MVKKKKQQEQSPQKQKQNKPTQASEKLCGRSQPVHSKAKQPQQMPFRSRSPTQEANLPLPPTPAWRIGSGHLFSPRSAHMFHGLVIIPCCSPAHTGYQTGKHSGNRSHSLSRQQGEEQQDLTLPAQSETGKRLLGSRGGGGDWAGTEGEMTRLPCGAQVGHLQACTSTPPA